MLDADITIAADTTRFKLPEASLGVFVTGGLSATLPAMVGLARAKAMTLLGEGFSAQQALAWGLIWRVVDDTQRDAESARVASALAAVVAQFKRVFNETGLAAFDRAIAQECRAQRSLAPG